MVMLHTYGNLSFTVTYGHLLRYLRRYLCLRRYEIGGMYLNLHANQAPRPAYYSMLWKKCSVYMHTQIIRVAFAKEEKKLSKLIIIFDFFVPIDKFVFVLVAPLQCISN